MNDNTINADVTMGGPDGALLAGRYRVVRQLGQGGMGSVWLAEDEKLDGFKVAIKMLPSVLVNNKRAYQQVKAEALVSLKLSHPNIATVRAFEEEDGNPFLVMDYIDGQTLDDYLAEKGKLTEDETVRLLKPIAAALDYAHGQGVIHRDVKPANVMIRKDGTPFVLDFGIAREIQETMTRVTGKLSSGTLLYMSPEQLRGQPPNAAQDVYSFAAMAYECLKGEPPFSRGQIEYQILNEQPERLPNDIRRSAAIMRGLSKTPDARPDSCVKVLLFSAAIVQTPSEELPIFTCPKQGVASSEDTSASIQKSKSSLIVLVVALLVVLGGVGGIYLQRAAGVRAANQMKPEPTRQQVETSTVVPESSKQGMSTNGRTGDSSWIRTEDDAGKSALLEWQSLQSEYAEEQQKTQRRLQELQKSKSPDEKLVLSKEQQNEITKFREKQAAILERMRVARQRFEKANLWDGKIVGVMTSLPEYYINGNTTNQWTIYKEIQKRYSVKVVSTSTEAIDNDIDVLVMIHPKSIPQKTLFAIDQYVLRGGRVIICVDPFNIMDLLKHRKDAQAYNSKPSSTLDELFNAWGITFTSDKLVADSAAATKLGAGEGRVELNPAFLSFGAGSMNYSDVAIKELRSVMFPFAGGLSFVENKSGISCYKLIFTSSGQSCLVSREKAQYGMGALQSELCPDGKSRVVAARLRGTFPTAFPLENDSGYVSASQSGASEVVIFGDADFIAEGFCLTTKASKREAINDNIALFMQVLQSLCSDGVKN